MKLPTIVLGVLLAGLAMGQSMIACNEDGTCQREMASSSITHRAYTLDEIDRMRAAVFVLLSAGSSLIGPKQYICGHINSDGSMTGSGSCSVPSDTSVEARLRTYIIAGSSPEELEAKAKGTQP
jgi:hypothetical protein